MQRQSLELMATSIEKVIESSKSDRIRALLIRTSIRMICGINITLYFSFTKNNLEELSKREKVSAFGLHHQQTYFPILLLPSMALAVGIIFNYIILDQMSGETIISTNRHPHFSSMMCTHSQQGNTRQPSLPRKMSASTSKKQLDMDKLIGDVKLTPAKTSKYSQCIINIRQQLQGLKDLPQTLDEVRTIQLLLNSLAKKIHAEGSSVAANTNHQRSGSKVSHQRLGSVSPIKQFDDINSHIVYTNFSIKGIQNSSIKSYEGQSTQRTLPEPQQLQTPIKRTLFDDSQNHQIERINSQIKMLQKILESKGINQRIAQRQHLGSHDTNSRDSIRTSATKSKYMQSENLCPHFRKGSQPSNNPKSGLGVLQSKYAKFGGTNFR